ncbi:MAG TPA: carboxylesterase family protein [Bryobacteraceae bacterium]|nr:carboxylesterase family protein [Bryobacteraceae bacterium]
MPRLLVSLILTIGCALALDDPIHTANGLVSGAPGKDPAVRVYKGIPYAAPPVGSLRWKAPESPASWEGVRPATEFSAVCMQAPYAQTSPYYSPLKSVSEDCLYLNVWTAAPLAKDRRPVMVWIHGGGYTRGSGSTPTYDGEVLAKKGVVVVTVNYRLGIFGFLAHPELTKESSHHSSGDYGLLDMVAALQWVQKNIAAFGGDPKRVTIYGESAGSSAVNFLMASPLAKGLFHRVIGESGANFGRRINLAEEEQAGVKFAEKSGASTSAAMRAISADDLLKAEGSFRPCVDGWFLPEDVTAIFAQHRQSDVPVIAGYNADEARTLAPWPANATAKTLLDQVHNRYGKFADEFLKLYPFTTDEQAAEAHYTSSRDSGMGWQMRTWVRMQSRNGKAPAFLYYFTRVPPGPVGAKYHAYHAAEIQYVFGNLRSDRPWEDADRKLSDVMSSYWANFAATGNPNGKGLPKWPGYQEASDQLMNFGDQIVVQHEVNKPALDFFDRFINASVTGGSSSGGN